MIITESRILDGQIIDYTKSPIPYMDPRFAAKSCALQAEEATEKPTKEVAIAKTESKPLWIEPKPVVKKKETEQQKEAVMNIVRTALAESNSVVEIEGPLNLAADVKFVNLEVAESSATQSLLENIKAALEQRKEAFSSLEEKTIEVKTTIKTIDWVLSLLNKE